MARRIPLWAFAAAFAIQAGLLGYMLAARANLLANGQQVRLPVVPVDPRDFFRGDYVVLSYPMSRLDAAELGGDDDFDYSTPIFVEITPDGEIWKPVALHREKPEGVTSIRGTVSYSTRPAGCEAPSCAVYNVDYDLEKFFVPEGEGRELEKLRNDQRMQVDAAVAPDGRAALKRLLVDGEVRYEEKLF